MLLMNRPAVLGTTLIAALGIGFLMQYVLSPRTAEAPPEPLEVTDITLTASLGMPLTPSLPPVLSAETQVAAEAKAPALPTAPAIDQSADLASVPATDDASLDSPEACPITLTAAPQPAAMVELSLEAACLSGEDVTFHHNGMMFTDRTDADGMLRRVVPALSPKAVFIASFGSGDGAVAQINVNSLNAYDRVVVQWRGGATGLGLHALEFDADYWGDGHIWADAPGTTRATAEGSQGVLTRLGLADGAEPLMAEVYTFPTRMASLSGTVQLSVEAEVTQANCGKQVDAQTLEIGGNDGVRVQDLTLFMPDCATVGDFLVLKNIVEDLTITPQ